MVGGVMTEGEALTMLAGDLAELRSERDALKAENARLTKALEELTSACERDNAGPTTNDFPDEDAVGGGTDGDMALTFGMIRRARAALSAAPPPADYAGSPYQHDTTRRWTNSRPSTEREP